MGIPVTRLTLDQPLANLGIDSLMAVLLRNQVENDLRIRVPVVRFLDGVGIAGLAAEMLALVDAPAPADALPDLEEGRL